MNKSIFAKNRTGLNKSIFAKNRTALFVITLILIILLCFIFISAAESEKVSKETVEKIRENGKIGVIIKIKDYSETANKAAISSFNINKNDIYKGYFYKEVDYNELKELEFNENIELISENRPIHAFLQNSVGIINASLAWPIQINGLNLTGFNETICIIDTGINFTHLDLIGKNKSCIVDCFYKACVENCSVSDDNGHGTHVAGIVAASLGIIGVAPNASLIGVKILDSNGDGSDSSTIDLSRAIDYCVSQNVSVISMSLGTSILNSTDCSSSISLWTESIAAAIGKNISVIAATGNSGSTTGISSPACIGNVTSVSSTTKTDTISSFSNRNNITDLFAPGGTLVGTGSCDAANTDSNRICSTYKNGAYISMSGTSMATPHVAGAFAILRQFYRLYYQRIPTPLEIQTLLNTTGKRITDSNGLNFSRIDVYSAILSIMNSLNLTYPENNFYTKINLTQFNCSFQSSNLSILSNATIYIWNSSSYLIYNLTQNISGSINITSVYYNLTLEGNYSWNCKGVNNLSQSFFANTNYTIIFDQTPPNITSISSGSITSSSVVISITANEPVNYSVNYGTTTSLGTSSSSSSYSSSHSAALSSLSASTFYYYNVTNCDRANNCNNSLTYNFTTSADSPPVVVASSGGGGGGSAPTFSTFVLSSTQAAGGSTKELEKEDRIKFYFSDEKEEHYVIASEVKSNMAVITIKSDPINVSLFVGESKKLSINSKDYYNFYIKLNSIKDNKVNLTIKTIYEKIEKTINNPTINNVSNFNNTLQKEDIKDEKINYVYVKGIILGIIVGIVFILALIWFIRKPKINVIESHKDIFNKHVKPKRNRGRNKKYQ